jgi:hypothetical protein
MICPWRNSKYLFKCCVAQYELHHNAPTGLRVFVKSSDPSVVVMMIAKHRKLNRRSKEGSPSYLTV